MRVWSGNTGRDSSGQGAVHLPGRGHAQAASSEHGGGVHTGGCSFYQPLYACGLFSSSMLLQFDQTDTLEAMTLKYN